MPKNVDKATCDFETRSEISLRKCGTHRYAVDPSTDVLCLSFRLPFWVTGKTALWHPAFPSLGIPATSWDEDTWDLIDWIQAGKPLEAHNAFFERCIWQHILSARYGWPEVSFDQWRCSAAKAAAHALPRGLDDALAALGLAIRKDKVGGKVMMKMTKPRKPRKAEVEAWEQNDDEPETLYHLDRHLLEQLWAYCRQDVLAEEALSEALDDLSPDEQRVYQLDQTINSRGFQIDSAAVSTALTLIRKETLTLNRQLEALTDGYVSKATQRAKLLAWCDAHGMPLPDTSKETVSDLLNNTSRSLPTTIRSVLRILQQLGKSSTAKYLAMASQMDPTDHRIRGGLLYHGASTGRWSGSGVQPHNFPKGHLKQSMDETWAGLLSGDKSDGDIMDVLSSALRGAITATPGRMLYVADYAGIEARVLLWLAGDEAALEKFRQGAEIYCEMASEIYGYPCLSKDTHPEERKLGKVAILGLGYQMGWKKFIETAWMMEKLVIDDEQSKRTVDAYRQKYWRTKNLWWDTEAAAIRAVTHRGVNVPCGRVTWEMPKKSRFLFCTLPSGRRLAYPDAEVNPKMTPWGELKPSLTYMGVNSYTRKWTRQTSYGGLLVENITQAVSRDLMAEALLRCESSGVYSPVLSVHDEVIAEADEGQGDVKEFEALVAECPPWAEGCPVVAEGWKGFRYKK